MGFTVWPDSLVVLPNMQDVGNLFLSYDFKATLADVFIKVCTGKAKEVHRVMYILCIPLILYFIV